MPLAVFQDPKNDPKDDLKQLEINPHCPETAIPCQQINTRITMMVSQLGFARFLRKVLLSVYLLLLLLLLLAWHLHKHLVCIRDIERDKDLAFNQESLGALTENVRVVYIRSYVVM